MGDDLVEDGVRYLVAELIGMALGHALGRDEERG
jgi:hypothetical protein